MRIFNKQEIEINLPKLIDSRMLLCANSGGGKSYAVRKILEEAGSDVMSIILDVEGASLNRCERSILSLLYNNPQREFTKTLVGLFAGYSHKSGGFNNAICHLNALGLIQRNRDRIMLHNDGQSQVAELLGSDINLHEQFTINNWVQKLPKCEGTIFTVLKEFPDTSFTKNQLGEATGYQSGSGGFNNAICRLNSLGLIIRDNGNIKVNEEILEL